MSVLTQLLSPEHILTKRNEYLLILLAVVFGASMRFVSLGSNSFWTDEFHTVRVAEQAKLTTTGEPADQHPPLYYLLLEKLVIPHSNGELAVRLPSAIFGTLAILLAWQIGAAFDNRKWGVLAALLLALAPLHIWYSRDARMYGMASFFWLGSLLFYVRTLRKDNWLDFIGLTAFTLGALLTAYPSFALWFIEIGLCVLVWYFSGKKPLRLIRWTVAQILIALGFAQWYPYFTRQMENANIRFQWDFPGPLGNLVNLSGTLQETINRALMAGAAVIGVAFLLSLIIIAIPTLQRLGKKLAVPSSLLLCLALLAVTAVGSIPRGLSIRRQLLVFAVLLIVASAWGLWRLRQAWLTGLVIAITLVFGTITALSPPFENWEDSIAYIAENEQAGDAIVVVPSWNTLAFQYYYQGDTAIERAGQGGLPMAVQERIQNSARVWLVVNSHPSVFWFSENARANLDGLGVKQDEATFEQNVTVYLYELSP